MVSRKIPARKHKGVKDPEKQAAARFARIKDKINNPPSELDSQAIPRRVQELKNAIEKYKNVKPRKRNKHKKEGLIDTTMFEKKKYSLPGMKRKEKPVPIFKQFPGESSKSFMHRITMKCQEVIHESQFEDKFNVDVKRNEQTGQIEGVEKRSKEDNLESEPAPNKKTRKLKRKTAEKKKQRLEIFKEKKQAKKLGKVDEFAHFKDEVKFGEIVHEPPKLLTLPRRAQAVDRPGKRDLLLKGMLQTGVQEQKVSVFNRNIQSDASGKVSKKKNDKSPVEKMRLEAQRIAVVQAYRDMKIKNNKNKRE